MVGGFYDTMEIFQIRKKISHSVKVTNSLNIFNGEAWRSVRVEQS